MRPRGINSHRISVRRDVLMYIVELALRLMLENTSVANLTDRSDEQSHQLFQGKKRPLLMPMQARKYSNSIPGRPATFVSARATATCPKLESDRDHVFACCPARNITARGDNNLGIQLAPHLGLCSQCLSFNLP